ncbi:class I SAM-dependent methyltransferase [Terribacillus sp. 7520-G]|uniref:class I SAM-dependent methyltransferase n=1 Tax=Terribacillus sp. 7520-G TaxID=2025389 RepID=UPI000BA65068|nr:class I SAM-dependent methyltransferase [Terribacillus sp. 7520-G]PAD37804.1 SAM-dependent methyltransferase [Terribacillus sp. 7520-G]
MNKKESSLTSLISAFSRAYHSQHDTPKIFDDYIAKELILPEEIEAIKANMLKGVHFFNEHIAAKLNNDTAEILKWIIQIQLSPTPLARAAYCEQVLHNEIALGAIQYVILGAGLDTFSFRHPELQKSLHIFEVDLPEAQTFKRKRLAEANFEIPSNLHFVSMDLSKKFSFHHLIKAGFNTGKKTFFSLLGVSYYLAKEEFFYLIDHLFSYVPPGSSIVFDYADEKLFEEKGISTRVENMVKMAAASGETMKGCFSYEEMESMLERSGLLIYEHLSPSRINELYFADRKDYLSAFETIHYIHAVKK